MKSTRRIGLLIVALFMAAGLNAQGTWLQKIAHSREVVQTTDNNNTYEIFAIDGDSISEYYLSVGTLGVGNKVIQVHIDPISNLYIKLGDNLAESIESMENLYAQVRDSVGSTQQVVGYISIGVPGSTTYDVDITTRKPLLTRHLEFSVQGEGFTHSTTMSKSSLKGLLTSLKFYKKLHKNEL